MPFSRGGCPDTRLADLTARLRADNQRIAERAQKLEASGQAPATSVAPQRSSSSVERAALAAIAVVIWDNWTEVSEVLDTIALGVERFERGAESGGLHQWEGLRREGQGRLEVHLRRCHLGPR